MVCIESAIVVVAEHMTVVAVANVIESVVARMYVSVVALELALVDALVPVPVV